MNEKEIIYSRALDKKQLCEENCMITSTKFLSIDEISIILPLEKHFNGDVKTYYYGGYDDAERKICVFVPKIFGTTDSIQSFFDENPDDNPLELIKINKDKFSTLTHRDYLGSLMSLGIKREMLGDIITVEDGCFIFCLKSIAEYICDNLERSGKGTVHCSICSFNELPDFEDKCETVFLSVASLRLDNILSAAFGISRTAAAQAINKGIVYVNSLQILKNDYNISQKDKIVLRGKGKVVFHEFIGESKKGRIHINVKKYK